MLPEMSEQGKFNEFFELTIDKSAWTNTLNQLEETQPNNTDNDDEIDIESSFISNDVVEININPPTGP
jgi:hypothetical protein